MAHNQEKNQPMETHAERRALMDWQTTLLEELV